MTLAEYKGPYPVLVKYTYNDGISVEGMLDHRLDLLSEKLVLLGSTCLFFQPHIGCELKNRVYLNKLVVVDWFDNPITGDCACPTLLNGHWPGCAYAD